MQIIRPTGTVTFLFSDVEGSTRLLRMGDLRSEHFAHHFLADCALIRADGASALPRYRRALELAVEQPLDALLAGARAASKAQGVRAVARV